jgi:hypothetical protein
MNGALNCSPATRGIRHILLIAKRSMNVVLLSPTKGGGLITGTPGARGVRLIRVAVV